MVVAGQTTFSGSRTGGVGSKGMARTDSRMAVDSFCGGRVERDCLTPGLTYGLRSATACHPGGEDDPHLPVGGKRQPPGCEVGRAAKSAGGSAASPRPIRPVLAASSPNCGRAPTRERDGGSASVQDIVSGQEHTRVQRRELITGSATVE
jgi:hypothetical protein